jgi:hypothetical protein
MSLMRNEPVYPPAPLSPRCGGVSLIGVATVVAALHLAALGGRLSVRGQRGRHVAMLIWQQPQPRPAETRPDAGRAPSHPTRSYSAGRLALAAGMVIVALAFQVQVMRVGAAITR